MCETQVITYKCGHKTEYLTQQCEQPSETCEKLVDSADSGYECMECHQAVFHTRYMLNFLLTRRSHGKLRFSKLREAVRCLNDQRVLHVTEVASKLDRYEPIDPSSETKEMLSSLSWSDLSWECRRRLSQEEKDLTNKMPPGEHNPPCTQSPVPDSISPIPPASTHSSPIHSRRGSLDGSVKRARSWPPRRKEQTEVDRLIAQEPIVKLCGEDVDKVQESSRSHSRFSMRAKPESTPSSTETGKAMDKYNAWEVRSDDEEEEGGAQAKNEKPKRSQHKRRPPQFGLGSQTSQIAEEAEQAENAEGVSEAGSPSSELSEEEHNAISADIQLVIETLKELARLLRISNFTWTIDNMDKAAELLYRRRKEDEARGEAMRASDVRLQALINQLTPSHLEQALRAIFEAGEHLQNISRQNQALEEVQRANRERNDEFLNVLFTVGENYQAMLAERLSLHDALHNYEAVIEDTLRGHNTQQQQALQKIAERGNLEQVLLHDREVQQNFFREQSINIVRELSAEIGNQLVQAQQQFQNEEPQGQGPEPTEPVEPIRIPIPTAPSRAPSGHASTAAPEPQVPEVPEVPQVPTPTTTSAEQIHLSPPPGSPKFVFPTFLSPGQVLDYIYYFYLALYPCTQFFLASLIIWMTVHGYMDFNLVLEVLPWLFMTLTQFFGSLMPIFPLLFIWLAYYTQSGLTIFPLFFVGITQFFNWVWPRWLMPVGIFSWVGFWLFVIGFSWRMYGFYEGIKASMGRNGGPRSRSPPAPQVGQAPPETWRAWFRRQRREIYLPWNRWVDQQMNFP
ncbi:MAG: hypothetical protein MMC33_008441 [Icmadophila ericetorum]|nr:hypothetical protein [Icmadophila ericetorum]